MSSNEAIDFESLEPEKPSVTKYNTKGELFSDDDKFALSKKVEHPSGKIAYFVSQYRGVLFDPWGVHSNKISNSGVEFKKTTASAFELYLRSLKTRDKSSLLLAERTHTHG